jgi:hypothetical protein
MMTPSWLYPSWLYQDSARDYKARDATASSQSTESNFLIALPRGAMVEAIDDESFS